MSLYPVRSISQLPALSAKISTKEYYQGDRSPLKHVEDDTPVENYKAYVTTSDNEKEKLFQWITDIPDGRLLIETSLSTGNGTYAARKFDFGNFLRYIGESLRILESRSYRTYLTAPDACKMFLPLSGGTLTGSLKIDPDPDGWNNSNIALLVNQGWSGNKNIHITNGTTTTILTENSITVPGNITCNNLTANNTIKAGNSTTAGTITVAGTATSPGSITLTGNITASNNINVGNNLTCANLTASTDFNLAGKVIIDPDNSSFVRIAKLSSEEIDVIIGAGKTTTNYLIVNEDTTFNKNVTVGKNLRVMNDLSANEMDTTDNKYHVFLKAVHVEGDKILSSDPGFSTDESVIGETVQGSTIKVGDSTTPSVYADSNGFTCTSKICNLTAQYACWA